MLRSAMIFLCLLMLGCAAAPAAPEAEPTPEVTEAPTPVPTQEPVPVIETQEIEAVLEEELPRSLKVTIQDLVVTFAKDLVYDCPDTLQVGDYIVISYTGEIEASPVALHAEKVK